jgi:hypothetical protein
MYYILIVLVVLIAINFLLLKFSSNDCVSTKNKTTKKVNMPERNTLISQPAMADK